MSTVDIFIESLVFLFVLLNPFLMSIYLLTLIQDLTLVMFGRLLLPAAVISAGIFGLFIWAGDAIFGESQLRFAAFLLFGGIVFLVVALRFVLMGEAAMRALHGPAEYRPGAIAMPFMVGPGTVSASVIAGHRLPGVLGFGAVAAALLAAVLCVIALKMLHDRVRQRHERLVEHYVDIVGRARPWSSARSPWR